LERYLVSLQHILGNYREDTRNKHTFTVESEKNLNRLNPDSRNLFFFNASFCTLLYSRP